MTRGPIGPSELFAIRKRLEGVYKKDISYLFGEESQKLKAAILLALLNAAAKDIEFLLSELDREAVLRKVAQEFFKDK